MIKSKLMELASEYEHRSIERKQLRKENKHLHTALVKALKALKCGGRDAVADATHIIENAINVYEINHSEEEE